MNNYIWLFLIIASFSFGGLWYICVRLILNLVRREQNNVVEFLVDDRGTFVGVALKGEAHDSKPIKCRVVVRALNDEELSEYTDAAN